MPKVIEVCGLPFKDQKIANIKAFRSATGAGLKEAKDFVEEVERYSKAKFEYISWGLDYYKVLEGLKNEGFKVNGSFILEDIDLYHDVYPEIKENINSIIKLSIELGFYDISKELIDIAQKFKTRLRKPQASDIPEEEFLIVEK